MIKKLFSAFCMWYFGKCNWDRFILVAIGIWLSFLTIAMIADSFNKTGL